MIAFPAGRVWVAGGVTDMRCGMNNLALMIQQGRGRDPHCGEISCFRGRKGDLIEILWHDGVGMSKPLRRSLFCALQVERRAIRTPLLG